MLNFVLLSEVTSSVTGINVSARTTAIYFPCCKFCSIVYLTITIKTVINYHGYWKNLLLPGPGTRLDRRLNQDGTPKDWSNPINRVDTAAYHHDLCYAKNRDRKTRNKICDREMIRELNQITKPSLREKLERGLVSKLINAKANFALRRLLPIKSL